MSGRHACDCPSRGERPHSLDCASTQMGDSAHFRCRCGRAVSCPGWLCTVCMEAQR